MIYINIGFPKTSTTNLQSNFYPKLQGIEYFGRKHIGKNIRLFLDLNNFVENREKYSKEQYLKLISEFKEYCSDKNILVSNENWVVPYQVNNNTLKLEIVPYSIKLKNLIQFLNDTQIKYQIFFIKRDLEQSIQSLFVTLSERIEKLFGERYLDFNYFLEQINDRSENYRDLILLIDVYNLKKIQEIIPEDKITVFDYEDLKNNREKFVKDLSAYLKIKPNYHLIQELDIKTRISKKQDGKYFVEKKTILSKYILFIFPRCLIKYFQGFLKYGFIKRLFVSNKTIGEKEINLLNKIIKDHYF